MTSDPGAGAPEPAPEPAAATDPAPSGPAAPGEADERRLHPAYLLIGGLKVAKNLVPAAIGLVVALKETGLLALIALAAIAVGAAVVEWRVTRYAVVDGALRLRSGLLSRSERVVPASRVSAVDSSRGLIQRLFGLVSLEVQTAGGGKQAEIKLEAVTFDEAERLRGALGHGSEPGPAACLLPHPERPATVAAPSPAAPAPVVYAITARELLIAALTGPQLGIVAVAVGSLASQARDLLPERLTEDAGNTLTHSGPGTLALLALGALLVAAVVSTIGTVLAFAEFTVTRDETRLRVRRGLLTERTGTVPLDRVHGVRVVEGLLRRPLGYATIQVEVAGYSGEDQLTRTLVPLVHRDAVPALLERLVPGLDWPARLHRPPARAWRRYLTAPVAAGAVAGVAGTLLLPGGLALLGLLGPLLGALAGQARWRAAGWHLTPGTLALRSWWISRVTLLAVPGRVQRVAVHRNPLQRRGGLATLSTVLATKRRGRIAQLDVATAAALQHAIVRRTGFDGVAVAAGPAGAPIAGDRGTAAPGQMPPGAPSR